MPAMSLNNMSVKLPASAADRTNSNQGLLMPKLQYRFRVNFFNIGVANEGIELTKQIMDCQRPTVTFDEITLNIYNSRMYLAGKHAWNELTMSIRDDANGNVSRVVGQQLQKQLDFMEQASAVSGQDYKFETEIEILDGGNGTLTPGILESWQLYGCFIRSANYQTLNYAESNPVTIQLNLRYDNALQVNPQTNELGDAGVGQEIPRTRGDRTTSISAIPNQQ